MIGIFEKNDLKITAIKVNGFREYPPMFHSHLEFVYVLKGTLRVCIDGKQAELLPDDMSLVFPYSVHSYDKCTDTEAIILMFTPENAAIFKRELVSFRPENPYIKNASALLPFFECILKYSQANEKQAAAYLNVIAGEVLSLIRLVKTDCTDTSCVQQVLMYCSEHFRESINAKRAASALYISESYLSKIFSNKLGYSFREYINILRITEAKKLLINTDIKITQVMYDSGFANQSSFNRVFLGKTGYTPKQYREIHR